ncbi:hypothetical protein K504DRAFT_494528 [Pleomassaria siparia CBS 279.74]|uniref:Uncharacterized protein n=1 Tax=Pleomassaria siparia CBS 279.74 TaxID=1314801 RepID=A0A6G1JWV6_9PLEO|nr:hypothetical protein K504DRAFT_494528 [Pleomassaria siparia CBS 279.74]
MYTAYFYKLAGHRAGIYAPGNRYSKSDKRALLREGGEGQKEPQNAVAAAQGSLEIPAVQYLLTEYPTYTVVLTVRDTSKTDANTNNLRRITDSYFQSAISIRKLNLCSLLEVDTFADSIRREISEGQLPRVAGLVCNAFFWTLSGGPRPSKDGSELSVTVSHHTHTSLAIHLLDSFSKEGCRVIFLGSDTHWPGNAPIKQFPPEIPDDLERIVHPSPDKPEEEVGRGFQRYGTAKLVVIMTMYELNNRLKELVLYLAKPIVRRAKHAGPDLIEVAVGEHFSGNKDCVVESVSSPESQYSAKKMFFLIRPCCGVGYASKMPQLVHRRSRMSNTNNVYLVVHVPS